MTILQFNRLKNVDDVNSNEIFVDVVEGKGPSQVVAEQDCGPTENSVPAVLPEQGQVRADAAPVQVDDSVAGDAGDKKKPIEVNTEKPIEGEDPVTDPIETNDPKTDPIEAKDPVAGKDLVKILVAAESPVPGPEGTLVPAPVESTVLANGQSTVSIEVLAQCSEEDRCGELVGSASFSPVVVVKRLSEDTIEKCTRFRLKRQRRKSTSDEDDDDNEDDDWSPQSRRSSKQMQYRCSPHFSKDKQDIVIRRIEDTLSKFYNFTKEERTRRVKAYFNSLLFEQKRSWLPKANQSYIYAKDRRRSSRQ